MAVTPANLIPACEACNKDKLTFNPATAEEQLLHPYFDDVSAGEWLKARVVEVSGRPVIEYFSDPPPSWSSVLKARLEMHLRVLKLPTLYTSHAAEELLNTRESLQRLRRSGGAALVHAHCREQEASRKAAHRNSWQAAYFCALAMSDWFCTAGVLAIDEPQAVWPTDPSPAMEALAKG